MHSKRCCMNDPARITNSINYKNDFALATWAPLSLCEDGKNSVDTAKREGIEIGMAKGKQEGLVEGMEKGIEKGRAEGKHEANTETAQRLLAMGLSAEQVAKATQLSLEIIKNLSNS